MSAVALGAVFLVAGCSPVKMGAAAVVGDQRITLATLDTQVTSSADQTATTNKLNQARCEAAKALNIKINPQFGRLNYTQYAVVTMPSPVSASPGPTKASSQAGLTPAC